MPTDPRAFQQAHQQWAAFLLQGRSGDALRAARALTREIPAAMVAREPPLEGLIVTPILTLVRFGMWDEASRSPAPPKPQKYATVIWLYAQGMALTAAGDLGKAERALEQLRTAVAALPPDLIVGANPARTLGDIATHVLRGEIAARHGRMDLAAEAFQAAVHAQDSTREDEPPDWYYPVRQSLGYLYIALTKGPDAEKAFVESLRRMPDDPWSLLGLSEAYRIQNRSSEESQFRQRFKQAWAKADVEFRVSRFEPFVQSKPPKK